MDIRSITSDYLSLKIYLELTVQELKLLNGKTVSLT